MDGESLRACSVGRHAPLTEGKTLRFVDERNVTVAVRRVTFFPKLPAVATAKPSNPSNVVRGQLFHFWCQGGNFSDRNANELSGKR